MGLTCSRSSDVSFRPGRLLISLVFLYLALVPGEFSMQQLRFRRAAAILPVLFVFFLMSAKAQQAPIALPYTMSTIAGTAPMAATAGTQCPNLPAGVKSTDAFGDGCLAVNGIFGAAGRGGVEVDAFGNVFVADDINSIIHVINPTTGIMTVLAGGG